MALRRGQKELVEQYRGGYCAVPAIPGGGKTHCLCMWAVEMISRGLHKPGKILIVTYMNSAVNNFKQRIANELQKRGTGSNKDYFVSTIHGLCLQIIKEKPDFILANEEFEIIDEVSKGYLINSAIDEWKRKNESSFKQYIDESTLSRSKAQNTYDNWQRTLSNVILGAIGDFKCRGINPTEAIAKCRVLKDDSILKCAAEVYKIYDRKLKMGGFLDFDDMLYNARKLLLEDDILLEKYREKYSFVCEDEAQDSNLIQSEILTMIANGNLLRVGDSNQAICGSFTNSDFKFFKDFCDLPETTVYNITQSSRNTKDIINFANHFVNYVRDRHPVEECRTSLLPQYIEPVGTDDQRQNPETLEYGINAGVFKSWDEEVDVVVKYAHSMLKKHPEKTIAILAPTSFRIKEIVNLIEYRNIPFEELDNTARERSKPLRMLGAVIDFIALPESGEKLADMLSECFLEEDYSEIPIHQDKSGIQKKLGQKETLFEFLKGYPVEKLLYPRTAESYMDDIPEELLNLSIWQFFLDKLNIIKILLEYPITNVERLILFIAEILNFDREGRAIAQKVASDFRFMVSQGHYQGLRSLANELLEKRNMFSFFAGAVWDLKGYEPKPGIVTISTYHRAKGLEWDAVFLTGLNNSDFPVELSDKFKGEYWYLKQEYSNPQAMAKADIEKICDDKIESDSVLKSKLETISERARLLYVGITRAEEYLFLSGFHANPGKKNENLPSKYLLELKRFISMENGQRRMDNGEWTMESERKVKAEAEVKAKVKV